MILSSLRRPTAGVCGIIAAMAWLVLISLLHGFLNTEKTSGDKVLMGYMPVITNLAAPLVDAATRGSDVYFEALKFGSFSEMAEAFKAGHIQAAFIIAPLSIILHQQGVPLKVVYVGNRHESTFVIRGELQCNSPAGLAGKKVAVPLRHSGHFLAIKRCIRQYHIDPDRIDIVEIPPPDMPAALAAGFIDGYFVGEPFASVTLKTGLSRKLLDVEEIWPRFMCNILIVQEQMIQSHPVRVQKLVSAAVRSGFWARDHVEEAVDLACRYWAQDRGVAEFAFSNPPGRIQFDLYVPRLEEFEELLGEMRDAGLVHGDVDLARMLEDRFARAVRIEKVDRFERILEP
ncbi:MAG: ABC transporter substrate-binding protein [Syntrophobacteraceae bacterium]|nr:ABC transporter substrate-binding protein [Syntrophobacteraceae bacterium]